MVEWWNGGIMSICVGKFYFDLFFHLSTSFQSSSTPIFRLRAGPQAPYFLRRPIMDRRGPLRVRALVWVR
jgi:hypothetical protein